MAQFFCRVELKDNPSKEDYVKLDALMKTVGFLQTVETATSSTFALPHATYSGILNKTLKEAFDGAMKAVSVFTVPSQVSPKVVVIESAGWTGNIPMANKDTSAI